MVSPFKYTIFPSRMFYYRHRLEMSHLHEWKYKHDLVVNLDIELTTYFLLHYPKFNNITHTLLSTLNNIDRKILESNDSFLTQTSLLGSTLFVTETYFFLTQPSTTLYSLKDSKSLFKRFSCAIISSFQDFSGFVIFIVGIHFCTLLSIHLSPRRVFRTLSNI